MTKKEKPITLSHERRVCCGDTLLTFTQQGWYVISEYDEEALQTVETVAVNPLAGKPMQDGGRYTHSDRIHVTQADRVSLHRFVLARSKDAAMEDLRAQLEEARSLADDAQGKLKEYAEDAQVLRKEVETLTAAVETMSKEKAQLADLAQTRLQQYHERNGHLRKVEEDMAKVRQHIGHATWNEVVGTKEEN